MKETRMLMGMPITVEIVDKSASQNDIDEVYKYLTYIDEKFSTYKENSEISKINKKQISEKDYSEDMKTILQLCAETKKETLGYFDCMQNEVCDPSGIVKGWAIFNAAELLKNNGFKNFYIDAGGDIQVSGKNSENKTWTVGIRNPFNQKEIIKILQISTEGVATSGTYNRGEHIYNPHTKTTKIPDMISLTIVGPNVYEADRFATAAFAMGKQGIEFIEKLNGFEGYMIDTKGIAIYTSKFNNYVLNS